MDNELREQLAAIHRGQQTLARALLLILERLTKMSAETDAAIAALNDSVNRIVAKLNSMHAPEDLTAVTTELAAAKADVASLVDGVSMARAQIDAAAPPV